MPAVAQAKWNTNTSLEDSPREAALVASAVTEGRSRGLPPTLVEQFFRAQIEAAKQVQRERFAEWSAAGRPPFPHAPDLQRDLRPKLDALTKDLLDALAAIRPHLGSEKLRAALAHHAPALLHQPGVSERAAALALEPLRSL
jgi:chorismate mutase